MSHGYKGHVAWHHDLQCIASSHGKPVSVTAVALRYTQPFCQHLIAHSSWDDRAPFVSPIYTQSFCQHMIAHGSGMTEQG